MSFDLQSGYGAGEGADMLQSIIKQKAEEAFRTQQIQQEQQRIALESQRAQQQAEYQNAVMKQAQEDHAVKQAQEQQAMAGRQATITPTNTPLDPTDPGVAQGLKILRAGGMGALLQPDQTLASAPLKIVGGQVAGVGDVQPGTATGAVRFMGTPAMNEQDSRDAAMQRFISAHPQVGDALASLEPDKRQAAVTEILKEQQKNDHPTQEYHTQPVLLDGKEAFAGFDQKQNRYFVNGQDVTSRVRPMPPTAMRVQIGGGGMGGGAAQTFDASRPDPKTANTVDARTGLTPNAIYQNAMGFALEGRLPPGGRASVGQAQNARMAIQNKAGALAAAAGTDLPTVQAEYRANAGTLAKLLPQAQATANFANTAKDNIQLALNQSPQVSRTDSAWVNTIANSFVRGATPAANLTKFETYIYTAAREYAKVTGGAAMSAAGLSDSAAKEASKLLNASQSPDAFQAAVGAMQDDMDNVVRRQAEGIHNVSSTIGNLFAVANGVPSGGRTSSTTKPSAGGAADYVFNPKTGRLEKGGG